MQNAYKKPDALKLFISAIFRRATKTNTRWFNTDYVEEKCEEFVLFSEQKPKKHFERFGLFWRLHSQLMADTVVDALIFELLQ